IGIGYGSFMNCADIEQIILPKELKFIGKYAFYGCWSLKGIDIPRGVEIIGDGAFQNSGLEFIEVWNSVIGDHQFANCKRLHTVIVHDTVEEIGFGAFTGCTLLENLTLPFVGKRNYTDKEQTVNYESSFVYIFATDVIQNQREFIHTHDGIGYTIPVTTLAQELARMNRVQQIFVEDEDHLGSTYNTDEQCVGYVPKSLINLTITNQKIFATGSMMNIADNTINPEYVSINDYPSVEDPSVTHPVPQFINLNLYDVNHINENSDPTVTGIGDHAFEGSELFKYIEMPNTIEEIGDRSFANNTKLETIVVSENLYRVEDRSFMNDTKLVLNILPDSVKEIGEEAFVGCDSITKFDFNQVEWIGAKAFKDGKLAGRGDVDSNDKLLNGIHLRAVSRIDDEAFYNNDGLTFVTVPESVVTLGKSVFAYSDGITNFKLENALIGERMFDSCLGLNYVIIPENITKVDPYAFANCTNLGLHLADGVLAVTFENDYIGSHMFDSDINIEKVVIPAIITTIDDYAFAKCTGITEIEFLNTFLGEYMFYKCTGLTELVVPENILEIRIGAFEECENLTHLTLPFVGKERANNNKEEALFGYIFGHAREGEEYKTTTQSYYMERDLYYNDIFTNYSTDPRLSATDLEAYEDVEFKIPEKLTTVIFTDETVVGYGAFSNAKNLTSIEFSEKLKMIDNYAFYN
ncbi:MAG: leucine-rich repeat domain-containing protein, partial [Anaeroplasmataceae bacterium]|nr:leucine-rich repeat domain-containing protein [Anaeroplasmataceae bacterium]